MNKIMTPEQQRVWAYLLKNRKADPEEIALNCDVTEEFASDMIVRIGTENWREEVPVRVAPNEGVKFDQGKARYDLLPGEFLEATAQVLTFGAAKYGERNWELGMNWGRPFAALMRHMWAWWGGEGKDPETGMSHLWHAACCLAFMIAYEARGTGSDDRPNSGKEE